MSLLNAPVAAGALIDTNLLVLYVIGTVNRNRIETFKRTTRYSRGDYDLLVGLIGQCRTLYTVPHVLAEVSNLIDLPGPERVLAKELLKRSISVWSEVAISSIAAASEGCYPELGLADAAIRTAARSLRCTVLTDDLDLYLLLIREQVPVLNFTHVRAQAMGV